MKPVKLAAGVMMPVMFLNGGRHPHVEGVAFQPEPQPTMPFVLVSTLSGTIGSMGIGEPLLPELQGPRFRVVL